MSDPNYQKTIQALLVLQNETVFAQVEPISPIIAQTMNQPQPSTLNSLNSPNQKNPHSFVFHPVHRLVTGNQSTDVVAALGGTIAWDTALSGLLPTGVVGLMVELYNSCGQSFQYQINGPQVVYLGTTPANTASSSYAGMELTVDLALPSSLNYTSTSGRCQYAMRVYPSAQFAAMYENDVPIIFAIVVSTTFVCITIGFFIYDYLVNRRNEKLISLVARSNAIVTSLFPGKFRDELIRNTQGTENLKGFINEAHDGDMPQNVSNSGTSKPMADLYLNTTIIFADVVGFTAWSSVREPSQVFSLLETIYGAFDDIAKQRKVFKVETVGDCYVAVSGLPDPRPDHAVVMARFARDIMAKMREKVQELEVTHGPDTGDLTLRIGLHSGPVTAGVLRGERARFQLFGDTMNTTARIESSGEPSQVHVSQETADLLTAAGKGQWLTKREDKVMAKGKGELQTYWLSVTLRPTTETSSSTEEQSAKVIEEELEAKEAAAKKQRITRLIEWNVETLVCLLKQIVARRNAQSSASVSSGSSLVDETKKVTQGSFLDEVKEIIMLPEFDSKAARRQEDWEKVILPHKVVDQLFNYVSCVANLYRDNPFHNFEHASHVLMSVVKLMSRIVAPADLELDGDDPKSKKAVAATLHDHTYGITSDPLTQFACSFSALIHDVDHLGVPNAQLVKEGLPIAYVYNNRSVAEQNSLELSWDLLMDPTFTELRATIYSTQEELRRFRQLVVNSVMATDIVDKDLKALRNARWERAFRTAEECSPDSCSCDEAAVLNPRDVQGVRRNNKKCQRKCVSCLESGATSSCGETGNIEEGRTVT